MDIKINYMVQRKTFYRWEFLPRYINDYELVYILDGCGEITVNEIRHKVKRGDLFCFRPNVRHSLCVTHEPYMEFFGLHFFPHPEDFISEIPHYQHIEEKHWIESMLKQLYKEYCFGGYMTEWKKSILLQQILCDLMIKQHTIQNPANTARIQKVLDMIHKSPFEAYTMENLTERAGIKKTVFLQSFRQITGTTPVQYINNLRLELASDLLLESRLSIAEISTRCGFADPFYFSRCFRRKYFISPKNYRDTKNKNT